MKVEITVRDAVPTDAADIYACIRNQLKETDAPFPPPDDRDAMAWILNLLCTGYAAVAIAKGRVVGSAGYVALQWPWNRGQHYVGDSWYYVEPGFRAGGTAIALMKRGRDWAATLGLPMMLGITTSQDSNLKDRFYRQQGLKYAGGWFYLPAPSAAGDGGT